MEKVKPIETDRLILCEIKEDDTSLIVKWRSDPEVYKYFFSQKPITEEEHSSWYFNLYMKDKDRIDFMAMEKMSKKKIGVFSVKRNKRNLKCSEIGYLLDADAQGKGYAQEAVRTLMHFAKNHWKCEEIILYIHEQNTTSQALAEKLDFKRKSKEGKFILYDTFL